MCVSVCVCLRACAYAYVHHLCVGGVCVFVFACISMYVCVDW